jgi:protein-L-isoaspartate(D-aspartate) O-methyltransferase
MQNEISTKTLVPVFDKTGCCGHILRTLRLAMRMIERVLRAMAKVPRHEFVPVEVQSYAYLNQPIPIGFDKTISQPLMVAVMTDLLELKPGNEQHSG